MPSRSPADRGCCHGDGILRVVATLPLLDRALDLLYPPRCVGCGAFGQNLCEACIATLTPVTGPGHCPRCGVQRQGVGVGESRCVGCSGWRTLAGARAAFEMEGAARRVVHGLKFSAVRDLATHMAEALLPVVTGLDPDAIYPIPLHGRRRRWRGFNQAEVLFERLGWSPAPGRLQRVRATPSQVGRNVHERRQNVEGAFRYRGPTLKGATVAVLDDVVTSGATAGECARVLLEHGAERVYALSYARASYRFPKSGSSDD